MSPGAPQVPGTRLVGAVLAAAAVLIAFCGARLVAPGSLAAAELWPDSRVDVNSATAAELCLLPGVGAGLAERIAADRALRGPFAGLDDLERVRGIGPATLDRLRPHAVAGAGE